jgi:hypothetical protein
MTGIVLPQAFPAVDRLRPAQPCPDHPGHVLLPLPGGAARGTCPVDGRSFQFETPEVTLGGPS